MDWIGLGPANRAMSNSAVLGLLPNYQNIVLNRQSH